MQRVAEKRKEGKSIRTIADEEGVDSKTIQKDLKEAAGVDGSTPEPEPEVKGKDGKTYKPKAARPSPPPAPQREPDPPKPVRKVEPRQPPQVEEPAREEVDTLAPQLGACERFCVSGVGRGCCCQPIAF